MVTRGDPDARQYSAARSGGGRKAVCRRPRHARRVRRNKVRTRHRPAQLLRRVETEPAMTPQQTIGHYRITSKLGEGGMGEVWRATDTKLHRDVAIKVLPEAFAHDSDRMARFTREAQGL